jgi:hypothetical protein
VSREAREVIADWLILFGAIGLLVALFLPWSHQSPHGLPGVARSPTAWQVYSVVDVLLAVLVGGLFAVALLGGRASKIVVLLAAAVAVAFTAHALSVPPTNGANLNLPTAAPASAAGEVVAISALGVAIAGLALSFTAE